MQFHRVYITPLDCYLEAGYGLYVLRATKNDNILQFFNDTVQAYAWLESRLTNEQMDDLINEMKDMLTALENKEQYN